MSGNHCHSNVVFADCKKVKMFSVSSLGILSHITSLTHLTVKLGYIRILTALVGSKVSASKLCYPWMFTTFTCYLPLTPSVLKLPIVSWSKFRAFLGLFTEELFILLCFCCKFNQFPLVMNLIWALHIRLILHLT